MITIYTHRDNQNETPYQTLKELLPLEKSHISQSLAHNEKDGLIAKPENNKYFTTIKITLEGIITTERYIASLNKILNQHP